MKIPNKNPFGYLRKECEDTLREAWLSALQEDIVLGERISEEELDFSLVIPPSLELGDLSTSICFRLSKQLKVPPNEIAEKIVANSDLSDAHLIRDVKVAGGGYVNFYADYGKLSKLSIESANILDRSYGYVVTDCPQKIIVEHTSVNPAGPIHIGTARNSVLGDSLSRLLRARGHEVSTHFYIDDVGRQIAVLAYGYRSIDQPKPKGKVDHWIGLIYAITSCILEIQGLKKQLNALTKNNASNKEIKEVRMKLDDWVAAAADLRERDQELFDTVLDGISEDEYPETYIAEIMRLYEKGNAETKRLVRKVVELCLGGFRETYARAGIHWNSWDWESALVWDGSVSGAIDQLKMSPYFTDVNGASALNVDEAAREMNLQTLFEVSERLVIPHLVLVRSDGTSLYSTRDIAYSLWKLKHADKVINVIGVEQSLQQLQLRIALGVLISPEKALDLIHYAYDLVKLPDYKMSKRRGRYVTFDEILDEAVKRAREEVEKRSSHLSVELKTKIAEAVGVGAVKYTLIEVDPKKRVVFTWDRVLNFEMNSAPFIQYAHARACNILKKAHDKLGQPDYSLLNESVEREIIRKIAIFPEVFIEAAENLLPHSIVEYANALSLKFNSFYASFPVLRAKNSGLMVARLNMVGAVKAVLRNSLELVGIKALERM